MNQRGVAPSTISQNVPHDSLLQNNNITKVEKFHGKQQSKLGVLVDTLNNPAPDRTVYVPTPLTSGPYALTHHLYFCPRPRGQTINLHGVSWRLDQGVDRQKLIWYRPYLVTCRSSLSINSRCTGQFTNPFGIKPQFNSNDKLHNNLQGISF